MMLGLADLKQTRVYQEGREEGEQRGRRMARRQVRDFLTTRFGILPPELLQQVEAVEDLERLDLLVRSAVSVASLAEFSSILAQGQEQPESREDSSDV